MTNDTAERKTMQGHTPGPWTVDRAFVTSEDTAQLIATIDSGYFLHRVPEGDYPIEFTEGQQRANARLIAAAPDLLIAAQNIYWKLSEAGRWNDDMALLRAAIAKARGEAS